MSRTQRERSDNTKVALVTVAREMFVRKGYAATSLDEVSATAMVTKGALYHHFKGKAALFCEVYEREQRGIVEEILAAFHRKPDVWSGFRAGVQALLTISCRPDVQRITLVDAPAVITWEARRDIEKRYTMPLLEHGLRLVIDDGWIDPRPVPPLARLLFGAMSEIAMSVAHSTCPVEDQAAAAAELDRIIDSLAAPRAVAVPARRG